MKSVSLLKRFIRSYRHQLASHVVALTATVLLMSPVLVQADWTDDGITNIKNNVANLKTNVEDLVNTIRNAKDTISDNKLKNMITDMRNMMQTAIQTQQEGLADFIAGGSCNVNDGTVCGSFKDDLVTILQNIENLNNAILDFHPIPTLNIQVEDPGLVDLVKKIPGPVLFPMYKVMTKTHLLDSGLIEQIEEAHIHLTMIKSVVYPDFQQASTLNAVSLNSVSAATVPDMVSICKPVAENALILKSSAAVVQGVGHVTKLIGTLFKSVSKTVLAGPVEMDAGIHGYVHGTLEQNTQSALGKAISGIGTVLASVGNFASNQVSSCTLTIRQEDMIAKLQSIQDKQDSLLANQQELLLGQQRVLCAFKHNLPDSCAQFAGNGFGNRGIK